MPFQWPGTLEEEKAWAISAFLLRENGLWLAQEPLTPENATLIGIPRQQFAPVFPTETPAASQLTSIMHQLSNIHPVSTWPDIPVWLIGVGIFVFTGILAYLAKR